MMIRKVVLGVLIVLVVTGCAAPQPTRPQAAPTAAAAVPTATRVRAQRPTPEVTATVAASPTVRPQPSLTVTPQPSPTVTPQPSPTATASPSLFVAPANPQPMPAIPGGASGVLLPLNPKKYSAPVLLTPDNHAVYHVAQPVVRFSWSAIPTDLITFAQTPGCVSDATNFRRALESYQLVIHSLEGVHSDIVQWTENDSEFDLNLTTVPAGRYAWSVNVVMLCESYVVGKRTATIQRSLVTPVSPTSAMRIVNWVP